MPTAGRALPAAQPHTEFVTTSTVPLCADKRRSTSAAVRASSMPNCVKSCRIGAISCSEYLIRLQFTRTRHGRFALWRGQITNDFIFADLVDDNFVWLP